MMDYNTWRGELTRWSEEQETSLQGACIDLSARVQRNWHISVNPFTLRHHIMGIYGDVGLTLAHAVWREIEADSPGD